MRFLDEYTIISNIEGSKCIFTRSAEGDKLIMYVDTPEGSYLKSTETDGIVTREKFEESYYFLGLLEFKRWKSRLKERNYGNSENSQFPVSA
ncbi:hypothetical protein [uncultured Ilyobacter sp.]|uniref:hypothetical protein n=1 Tax=uncultured Ilyobacter sp. TaxID=544433 RepID=UPI0029C0BA6E|nr:hypothetical protein [uncultured Ilyobacter sp.]